MSPHADVAVPARDRRRLERLCCYVARPPLANDRLEERSDGRFALRLKTRWRNGTTHIPCGISSCRVDGRLNRPGRSQQLSFLAYLS